MDPDFLNEDIQDLIEGRLAPERVDAVRARLASDPELRAAVQDMAAQRRSLQQAGAAEQRAAESNPALVRVLVRSAMARAGSAAAQAPAPPTIAAREASMRGSGRPQRRRAAPLVALMAAFFAIGLGSMWLLDVLQHGGSRKPEPIRPQEAMTMRTPFAPPAPTDQSSGQASDAPAAALAQGPALPDWLKIDPTSSDPAEIGAWTEEFSKTLHSSHQSSGLRTLEQLAAEPAAAPAGSAQGDNLTLQDAAQLALQGRLRFVISSAPPRATPAPETSRPASSPRPEFRASSREESSPAARGVRPSRRGSGATGASLNGPARLDVRLDPELASLQDRLSQLVTQAELAGQRILLEVLDPQSPERSSVLPGIDVNDVLWWDHPTSDWSPSASLLIPLRRE